MAEETMEADKRKTHTRFIYAMTSTALTFGYLFSVEAPDAAAAFTFLSFVAGGLGIAKATEHLKLK